MSIIHYWVRFRILRYNTYRVSRITNRICGPDALKTNSLTKGELSLLGTNRDTL